MQRIIDALNIAVFLFLAGCCWIFMLQGCSSDSSGINQSKGTLKVLISDSPAFRSFSSVHIRVAKVMAVPAGSENATDDDPELLTVADFTTDNNQTSGMDVDILKLHFLQQALGSALAPAGNYSQVRLILAANTPAEPYCNYFILAGSTEKIPLTTPSAHRTGVKVNGRFAVAAGVVNTILLDFDPNEAIVKRGHSGENNLKPTGIRIVQIYSSLENAASISGWIRSSLFNPWSSATVSVVSRDSTAGPVASGAVFSSFSGAGVWKGPFVVFVPPSDLAGNYRLFVQAYRDTGLRHPVFTPYSSPLLTIDTGGQDYPVPPDGIVALQP